MQVVVKGKHFEVTPALRNHAEEKATKLQKYSDRIQTVEYELTLQKNWQTAEVNLVSDQVSVRAQERSLDMYESIDLVTKKIEKQLRRFKEKLKAHPHNSRDYTDEAAQLAAAQMINDQINEADHDEDEADGRRIVRTKAVALKPVSPEEAAEQMELVGHDFYVFLNSENDQVNVIYHRNDGNYGLIQPGV